MARFRRAPGFKSFWSQGLSRVPQNVDCNEDYEGRVPCTQGCAHAVARHLQHSKVSHRLQLWMLTLKLRASLGKARLCSVTLQSADCRSVPTCPHLPNASLFM